MSLLKLHKKDDSAFLIEKSIGILNSLPFRPKILEAFLFGSAINGHFTEDSDLDLLLTFADPDDIKQAKNHVYGVFKGDIAIDWILKTQERFDQEKDIGGVSFEAFHHGKKII